MSAPERRFVPLETRGEGDDLALTGRLATYDRVYSFGGRPFRERIARGAFGPVAELRDVIANVQHDRQRPVARIGAGLTLREDADGLLATVEPRGPYAADVRGLVDAGLLRGFSVEMRVADAVREADGTRRVQRAQLLGLGVVDRPAYDDAVIARQWEDHVQRLARWL